MSEPQYDAQNSGSENPSVYTQNQNQSPVAPTPAQAPVTGENNIVLPASLLRRFTGFIIDRIVSGLLMYAITFGVIIVVTEFGSSTLGNIIASSMYVFAIFIGFFYYLILEGFFQKSIGKMVTGTKVVNLDGEKPSFGSITIRSLSRLIPFEALSFLFYGKYPLKGWHDRFSKTIVVPKGLTPEQVQSMDPVAIREAGSRNFGVNLLIIGGISIVIIFIIGSAFSIILAMINVSRDRAVEMMDEQGETIDGSRDAVLLQILEVAVEETNRSLPAMVNQDLQMVQARVGDDVSMHQDFKLVNYEKSFDQWDEIRDSIVPIMTRQYCTAPELVFFKENGIPLHMNFSDKNDELLDTITFNETSC